MVSPGPVQLPAYSPGAATEGAGEHAGQDTEYDPDSEDRDDAEQDQQRCFDHETLLRLHNRAGVNPIVTKRTCLGTVEVWLASQVGQSVREHPGMTSVGRTDIYLCNGGDREEGPVSTTRNVSAYQYMSFGRSRTKKKLY
jgi:hypothetical protein